MLFTLAQRLFHQEPLQFTRRTDRHLFQDAFNEWAVGQRRPPDQRDQGPGMAPECGADVTLRPQVLEHLVAREALAHADGEAADLPAHDLCAQRVLQSVGQVVLDLNPGSRTSSGTTWDRHESQLQQRRHGLAKVLQPGLGLLDLRGPRPQAVDLA